MNGETLTGLLKKGQMILAQAGIKEAGLDAWLLLDRNGRPAARKLVDQDPPAALYWIFRKSWFLIGLWMQ